MTASVPIAAKANPPLTGGELALGGLLAAWIVACDVALEIVARIGGCPGTRTIDSTVAAEIWTSPEGCAGTELAGPAVVLVPGVRYGTVLGLLEHQLHGVGGQIWGLGLLAIATIVSILVLRWRWRSAGDAAALGCLWAGVILHALPRLVTDGHTFTELRLFGLSTGIGDLALLWSVIWLIGRWIGELRA